MASIEYELSNHKTEEIISQENNEEEIKDIYFIILYPIKKKNKFYEIHFSESDIIPEKYFEIEKEEENGAFFYIKIFKFNGKTNNNYNLEFELGKDCFIITFEVKENSFIYDIELKKGNKILTNIDKEIIDQNIIDYHKKLDIFLEALKKNNEEESKRETLYKDTIDLFEKRKGFSFLISLFTQIYKNKKLCTLLIEKFKEMNIKPKDNEKNMDRNKELEQYIYIFRDISSEADNIIESNGYDPIHFYGIILCYLNYYDYDIFMKICHQLIKENSEQLYEILILYFSNFLNPINQNVDFFVKFFRYITSKKDFNIFENGFNYIKDLETFIIVIEKTKEEIFDKYITSNGSFKPIKSKTNLEFIKIEKNKEMNGIIPAIESIISYSKQKKILLVYFTTNFWIKILNKYNVPDDINIKNCYELRKIIFEYNDLVNELYKKEKNSYIKKDINKYFEKDELAFLLDKNIKTLLNINKKNKKLSNSEILVLVVAFNPYYKEDKYIYKRDSSIFDYIDLDDNDEQFIETFKNLKFEKIFKDNKIEFLNKMISKINNISNFGTILKLIDIKKISKINDFYYQLKDKYEHKAMAQIDSLTGKQLLI